MKKALTTIAILGGIAAAVAYKLKKDEERKTLQKESFAVIITVEIVYRGKRSRRRYAEIICGV